MTCGLDKYTYVRGIKITIFVTLLALVKFVNCINKNKLGESLMGDLRNI